MSRPWRTLRTAALGLLLPLLVLAGRSGASEPGEAEIRRLEAAVERYPDDPDLLFALAQHLASARRLEQAVLRLGAYERRWPERHPDAALVLGQWLYELGRDEEAVAALGRAVLRQEGLAEAHLQLGLALARLRRVEEAARELRRAGELDPTLRAETRLLEGLLRLESGDASGEALLRESIDLEPRSAAARRARLVLGEAEPPARPLAVELYSGAEYDSNVTLASDEGVAGAAASDSADARATWRVSAVAPLLREGRLSLSAGARYDGTRHFELGRYDMQRVMGLLSGDWRAGDRASLRLDGLLSFATLDADPYLLSGLVRPAVILEVGKRVGVMRLFGEVEALGYDEDALYPSLERDGLAWGGGLEHFVPIGPEGRGWLSAGASWSRLETEGGGDLLGFEGAYDHDRWRGSLGARVPLPWSLSVDAALALSLERYANDNLIGFLTELERERRRDLVLETWLRLRRALSPAVDLELSWRYVDRGSNVDLYAYDRHIAGIAFRIDPLRLWQALPFGSPFRPSAAYTERGAP